MKVKYLRTVKIPPCKAGDKGEIKDLADHLAKGLIEEGYVKATSQKKGKTDENSK